MLPAVSRNLEKNIHVSITIIEKRIFSPLRDKPGAERTVGIVGGAEQAKVCFHLPEPY